MVIPEPQTNESPASYADRLGKWYSGTVSHEHKKSYGQYLTPSAVARFMAHLFQIQGDVVRLLDPGAGSGVLTCAVGEYLATLEVRPTHLVVEAYETDLRLASVLKTSLAYLETWLSAQQISFEADVRTSDFVLTYSESLSDALGTNPSLFNADASAAVFDLVIANPPYFKIPKSDSRAKAASAVIHGQPNIYALFMAASAAILKPGGQLVFITPRSFTSGPYFSLFRERFFGRMKLEHVHVFESRTEAFKRDDILQENIIVKASSESGWADKTDRGCVWISSSNGATDFTRSRLQSLRTDLILDMSSADKVLHVPTSAEEVAVMERVLSWRGSLKSYGLEISTGPVVPFRATRFLDETREFGGTHAPLLWMQHVTAMKVLWPISGMKKPQYIRTSASCLKLLVSNKNYVLLRRFSAKEELRRLVAAPLLAAQLESSWLGLENHLNYIHRPGGELTQEEAWGLSALYNSSILDSFFRTMNGNTQVSATELRAMPLPAHEIIVELGRAAMASAEPLREIDTLFQTVLIAMRQTQAPPSSAGSQDVVVDGAWEVSASG